MSVLNSIRDTTHIRKLSEEFGFDYDELTTVFNSWTNKYVAVVFSMYIHYNPKVNLSFLPKDLYDILKNNETWKEMFKYLGMTTYFSRAGIIDADNNYTIDPFLLAKYLLHPGDSKRILKPLSNLSGRGYFLICDDLVDGVYVIQDHVHRKNFDAYEDSTDPRNDIMNRFMIRSDEFGECFRIVIQVVKNVIRTMMGEAQDDSHRTWNQAVYSSDSFYGNTILLQLSEETYMMVGGETTYEFDIPMGEYIYEYCSFLNSDTRPNPLAVSENYVYLLDSFPILKIPSGLFSDDMDWKNVNPGHLRFGDTSHIVEVNSTELTYRIHAQKRLQ